MQVWWTHWNNLSLQGRPCLNRAGHETTKSPPVRLGGRRRTPTLVKDKTASCCFLTIYLDSVCWQSSFPLRYIANKKVFHTEGFQGMEHFEGVAYRHEEDMLCIENDECSKISPGLFCKWDSQTKYLLSPFKSYIIVCCGLSLSLRFDDKFQKMKSLLFPAGCSANVARAQSGYGAASLESARSLKDANPEGLILNDDSDPHWGFGPYWGNTVIVFIENDLMMLGGALVVVVVTVWGVWSVGCVEKSKNARNLVG